MPVPPMVGVTIPIGMQVCRMLREDVVVPVRGKIVSIANLSTAGSLTCYIGERLISAVRKMIISAIHIAPRELVPGKRAAHVRIHGA